MAYQCTGMYYLKVTCTYVCKRVLVTEAAFELGGCKNVKEEAGVYSLIGKVLNNLHYSANKEGKRRIRDNSVQGKSEYRL